MKIQLQVTESNLPKNTCLIIPVTEDAHFTPTGQQLDKALKGSLLKLIKAGRFQAKVGQTLPLFHCEGYEHILLVGCGNAKKVTESTLRKIIFATLRSLTSTKTKTALSLMPELNVKEHDTAWKVKFIAEVATEALYAFDDHKSKKEPKPELQTLTLAIANKKELNAAKTALQQGLAIGDAVTFTKNLANTPSNICTPRYLAQAAKALSAKQRSIKVNVLDEKAMQKLGMGALLAVSKGSSEPAQFIILEYRGGPKNQAPIAFVGKGITFDTGGNSIKPADSMVGMKYDMCGAATVLGTLQAAAELKLPLNIVGLVPAVENMPGGNAYKPEDILVSMSGQTIEVISTDAEGRLILADALTYCERYKPRAVIDIATLTGAVVIALGFHTTGLLTNHQALADALLKAGEQSYDRAWQLPMYEEYQEQIKSPFADMANTGGRSAGTITAAAFLSRFADKFNWAHLDVAGTAAMMMGTSERAATGRPVPMLVQYLINEAG